MTGFYRPYDEDELARHSPPKPLNPRFVAKIQELRDEHIRRYAELIKEEEAEVSRQSDAKPKSGPKGGR